ncbi:MAG TPA: carboxypeptidase-like regulatory domain-containing protein [Planctomycetota bacterium]|nr:carboxypeptidase-like regulatory domain-containing protein [Planctomycetota bacterium]
MRASHVAAFVFLLLLGALGVWWATHLDTGLGQPEAPAAHPSPFATEASGTVASDRTTATGSPSTEASATDTAAPATLAQPTAPTGRLRVLVRSERGDALEGCHVFAGGLEGDTDREGAATFEVAAQRTFLSVDPPKGLGLASRSGWQTVRAEELTEVRIVLAATANMAFWCQFVAAGNEQPLAGVPVRVQPDGSEHTSDAQGFVQVGVTDDRTYLDVRTPSLGPCRVVPQPEHVTRATALRVPLAAAATLRVRVVDPATAPVPGFELELRVQPWRVQQPEQVRTRGEAFVWTATSDVSGGLTITGLPIGVPIEVTARAPVLFTCVEPPRWVLDKASEERTIALVAASQVHGRVTGAAGQPVAGVTVLANAPDGEHLPRVLGKVAARSSTVSAADGTFQLGGLAPGRWWIGIPHNGEYQPVRVAVEVPIGGTVEVPLQAIAGPAVAGRAVGPDGAPASGVVVNVHVDDEYVAGARTDAEGRFRVGNLPAGACELRTEPYQTDLGLGEPATVQTGEENVELHLTAVSGSISGRCIGSSDVWVMAFRRGSGDALGARCDLDGTFLYGGLLAGTWDLQAFDRSGHAACLGAVQVLPGRETAGVLLELAPAAVLRPRHAGADEFTVCRGEHVACADNLEPGVAGEARVPPGTWTVVFRAMGREVARREVTVRAGDDRLVEGGS